MKKKILIGSLLVLTLLLLMPSIPAVQQKTIEDKAYSDFVEELKDVDLEDLQEKIEKRNPKFMDYLKNSDVISKLENNILRALIIFIIYGIMLGITAINVIIWLIFERISNILHDDLQILPLFASFCMKISWLFFFLLFLVV